MNLIGVDYMNNKKSVKLIILKLSVLLLMSNSFAASSAATGVSIPSTSLYQLGNASALFSGLVEGNQNLKSLMTKGNFGLGTFNDIDGELVAVDGKFFKIGQKGVTTPVESNWKSPFVELVKFKNSNTVNITNAASYDKLKQQLATQIDNKNIPYAIKISGTFDFIKLRSRSPRKSTDNSNIVEEIYTANDIKGTLVGYWFPDYLLSLTVPAFHFHFIADDHKLSGHVLEVKSTNVRVAMNKISQIEMAFPQSTAYKEMKINAATIENYQNAQMNNK